MLLDLDPAVFDAPDHKPVIDVLTMVAKQRHDWTPTMTHALRADQFVSKLTSGELRFPILAEWARKAVEESAHRHHTGQPRVRITLTDLEHAVADLGQPAVLVVENRLGDGAFVRRVAAVLGEHKIVEALDKTWLRFSNGGGTGDMPRLAADERRLFHVVIRVAVLFDSDRTRRGQASPNDRKVQQVRLAGVHEVHMLTWRMMENYLPFCIWEHHFPDKPNKIASLRQMIPEQRGYVRLKKEYFEVRTMPSPLIPDQVVVTEADFAELGPDVVAELRELLAMIHRIL